MNLVLKGLKYLWHGQKINFNKILLKQQIILGKLKLLNQKILRDISYPGASKKIDSRRIIVNWGERANIYIMQGRNHNLKLVPQNFMKNFYVDDVILTSYIMKSYRKINIASE